MIKIKTGSFFLCLLLSLTIGGRVALSAEKPAASSQFKFTAQTDDPLQILFLLGLHELTTGNYIAAVQVFKSLSLQTDSLRVKLELARALFLDLQYKQAKTLLEEVQSSPETPYPVKESIQFYLDQIDVVLGTIKYGLSIVTDSNPRNFTDSRRIKIAGKTLTLNPPSDNKDVVGIRYNLLATKALTDDGLLTGYLRTSYADFPNTSFDSLYADLGTILSFKKNRVLRIRLGLEESIYAGDHLYDFPYLGFMLFPRPLHQFQLHGEFKIGKLRVPDAPHLDALNFSLTTSLTRKVTDNSLATANIFLEHSITDERAYTYQGGSIGTSLDLPIFVVWRLKPYVTIGERLYKDRDPFFGKTRRDTRKTAGIVCKLDNLKMFGLTPALGITYEKNSSSLDYFSYDKVGFIFDLQ